MDFFVLRMTTQEATEILSKEEFRSSLNLERGTPSPLYRRIVRTMNDLGLHRTDTIATNRLGDWCR